MKGLPTMPIDFTAKASRRSLPIRLVRKDGLAEAGLDLEAFDWAEANGFTGKPGSFLTLPGDRGKIAGALYGVAAKDEGFAPLALGGLARQLPEGDWHLATPPVDATLAAIGFKLGSYVFTRYGKKPGRKLSVALPQGADAARVARVSDAVFLVRDLVNTPTNDMGPDVLEKAVRTLAAKHKAKVTSIVGDALLKANFPMIHAVGRASATPPRLIEMNWGNRNAPKVTLVGKGVCFDTGGLDIKPSSNMLLMKKDMGGAAHVLGLASMIMTAGLNVRLRVLIPAVENSISGNAFRPGDILQTRKGITVEIGNTDAEGRLILGDALTLADEDKPELLIDMATLTGAARVAVGPDLAPFYTDDDRLAADLHEAGKANADPLWRMPLWQPYDAKLASKVADINNITPDSFAGSVTAALFLKRFVENAAAWVHFDIFAWCPSERPHCPVGAEAQAIRALEAYLLKRYSA